MAESTTNTSGSSKRGFAAMSKKRQREIASEGGRASHRGRKQTGSAPRQQEQ